MDSRRSSKCEDIHSTDVWTIERVPLKERQASIAELVRSGLSRESKQLNPILFYDAEGSRLFERICNLEEYYVTRTERGILKLYGDEIVDAASPMTCIGELGSGSSEKSEIILRSALKRDEALTYLPIDISESALVMAADRLNRQFPKLGIHAVVGDYFAGLERVSDILEGESGLHMFLGSNLGNFEPEPAQDLLREVRSACEPGDHFLIGLDLVKDPGVLISAYDDREGVTAAFNLNLLRRINDELDGNFDLSGFFHQAIWNEALNRVEMHLVSRKPQEVRIEKIDSIFYFDKGESIHTESSHKFNSDKISDLARITGWTPLKQWVDEKSYYSLNLWAPGS